MACCQPSLLSRAIDCYLTTALNDEDEAVIRCPVIALSGAGACRAVLNLRDHCASNDHFHTRHRNDLQPVLGTAQALAAHSYSESKDKEKKWMCPVPGCEQQHGSVEELAVHLMGQHLELMQPVHLLLMALGGEDKAAEWCLCPMEASQRLCSQRKKRIWKDHLISQHTPDVIGLATYASALATRATTAQGGLPALVACKCPMRWCTSRYKGSSMLRHITATEHHARVLCRQYMAAKRAQQSTEEVADSNAPEPDADCREGGAADPPPAVPAAVGPCEQHCGDDASSPTVAPQANGAGARCAGSNSAPGGALPALKTAAAGRMGDEGDRMETPRRLPGYLALPCLSARAGQPLLWLLAQLAAQVALLGWALLCMQCRMQQLTGTVQQLQRELEEAREQLQQQQQQRQEHDQEQEGAAPTPVTTGAGTTMALPATLPPAPIAARAEGTVRVASWNLKKLTFSSRHRPKLANIVRSILDSGADLVALQEVADRQAVELLKAALNIESAVSLKKGIWASCCSKYTLHDGSGYDKPATEHAAYLWRVGSGVQLMRAEGRDAELHFYSMQALHGKFLRSPFYALFSFHGQPTLLINCHLRSGSGASVEVSHLHRLVDAARTQNSDLWPGIATVLLGDFNLSPTCGAWRGFNEAGWEGKIEASVPTNTIGTEHYDDIIMRKGCPHLECTRSGVLPLPDHLEPRTSAFPAYSDHLLVWADVAPTKAVKRVTQKSLVRDFREPVMAPS